MGENKPRLHRPLGSHRRVNIIALAALLIIAGVELLLQPLAQEEQRRLQAESTSLRPPPSAELIATLAGSKPLNAFVESTYRTDLDLADVKDHYRRELHLHRWAESNDSTAFCFTKGQFLATVVPVRDNSAEFELILGWNFPVCSPSSSTP